MPKRAKEKKRSSCRDDDEYVKAAAWAWYQHGAGAPSNFIHESDAQNRQKPASTSTRPSRFKLEATTLNPSPSLHTVRTRPKSFHGLDRSTVVGSQMFESDEDVSDSSLLDYYEIVELSRHLEKSLPFSVNESAIHGHKSWIERGLSADLVHTPTVFVGDNSLKKKISKVSKSAVAKHWWTPVMCSMTDVVIPSIAEIGSPKKSENRGSSWKKGDLKVSERFHGVRRRVQQALVVSAWKSPSHGNTNIGASSGRLNSLDASHKRQTCDRGLS